jgi:uncharacterized protein
LGRIVLILIIAFVIYLIFRGFFRPKVKKDGEAPLAKSGKGEDMVQCSRCGVNLPRSEAREMAGKLICNDNPRCRGPE